MHIFEAFQLTIHQMLEGNGLTSTLNDLNFDTDSSIAAPSDSALQLINGAFLIVLAGPQQAQFEQAQRLLNQWADDSQWGAIARFYQTGISRIQHELQARAESHPEFADQLQALSQRLQDTSSESQLDSPDASVEAIWSLLFPEGVGIRGHEQEGIEALRARRTVQIQALNPQPIAQPGRELLLTSNALLTLPLPSTDLDARPETRSMQAELAAVKVEPQLYWYDHPIPVGVAPESNEILYGLRALSQAIATERQRGTVGAEPVACVLSVSVTHKGLQAIAKPYLRQVLLGDSALENLDIYAVTEADTEALIHKVLLPAIEHYLPTEGAADLLQVFGVDGRYGRHYSFLKAIAAVWNVLVDPAIRGTFKIDLDQVFPQDELVAETGQSAFEHFCTPLWGATGTDADGSLVDLGLIAGALVNQKDIHRGLFTPDVPFPVRSLQPDEWVFFSGLPQALSTEAEMMTRYTEPPLDGTTACLQRIHVTGGTNGILVDRLRQYRPFTPSFIGRAEDQAYLLSVLPDPATPLRYVHEPGLIMRHDKEGFAQEAIKMAKVGKLIGDYERILLFSAYAHAVSDDVSALKRQVDPFTGCFISHLPQTVVHLRFALKAATLFNKGEQMDAHEFIKTGIPRLVDTLAYVEGGPESPMSLDYVTERRGWALFYDALDALERAIAQSDPVALDLQTQARTWIQQCRVSG